MPRSPQPLPTTGDTEARVRLARQIGRLLGPWYSAPDGSRNAADLIAHAQEVDDTRTDLENAGLEAFINLTTYLLSEYEGVYGITAIATTTEGRRAALLARSRAGFVAHPVAIDDAIRDIAGTDTDIIETLYSEVTALPRNVHVIVIRMDPNVYGIPPIYTQTFFDVQTVVERMKPAHVQAVYTGTQTTDFLTDDTNSLTDNTVLRA